MMLDEKEIQSLIRLLDDPDEAIFSVVEEKLLSMGSDIITLLEQAWEQSFDALVQERIENLIHQIQFGQVQQELRLWKMSGSFDLLHGLILINKYQYPDMDEQRIVNQVEAIKRDAWMELIYDMSAVEKIRLLNTIFYNTHGFSGNTSNYHDPQNSYIGQVLESRKGNPIMLACIYSIVAQKLDIPVYGINLPRHFILAYTEEGGAEDDESILFYVNAFNRGQILGRHDIIAFLRQLNLKPQPQYLLPCTHIDIISRVLRNLIAAYQQQGTAHKANEAAVLLAILEEE